MAMSVEKVKLELEVTEGERDILLLALCGFSCELVQLHTKHLVEDADPYRTQRLARRLADIRAVQRKIREAFGLGVMTVK